MNQSVARTQENPADIAERYVRQQLSPKPGEEHLSPLLNKRKAFLEDLSKNLDPQFYDTPEKRAAKLESAGKEFDAEVIKRAREGAVAGGDAGAYKMLDPEEKRQKDTSAGLIRGVINTIVGGLGGIFSFLWDLLKHLPVVGDMISSIGDKRTPEEKARDKKAAGVADKLSIPMEIQGVSVTFSEDERMKIFNGLRKPQAEVAAAPAPMSPAPAEPDAQTAAAAAQAAEAARRAGTSGGMNAGANGDLPGAPANSPAAPPVKVAAAK